MLAMPPGSWFDGSGWSCFCGLQHWLTGAARRFKALTTLRLYFRLQMKMVCYSALQCKLKGQFVYCLLLESGLMSLQHTSTRCYFTLREGRRQRYFQTHWMPRCRNGPFQVREICTRRVRKVTGLGSQEIYFKSKEGIFIVIVRSKLYSSINCW